MTHKLIHDDKKIEEIIGNKVFVDSWSLNAVYQDDVEEIVKQYAEHILVKFIDDIGTYINYKSRTYKGAYTLDTGLFLEKFGEELRQSLKAQLTKSK